MFAQQVLNGLVVGSAYALFALGFTLVFGVNRVLNLAHGAVFTWGAFAGLWAITECGLPLPAAIVLAMLTGGVLSVGLDFAAFRPLRRHKDTSEYGAIVSSIGAGLVLLWAAQQASGTRVMRFPFDAFPVVIYRFWGLRIPLLQLVVVGCVALLVLGLLWLLHRTSFGRQVRAVAQAERTALLLGVDAGRVQALVFFLSGALAGAAGVLLGLAFNSVHYLMGEPLLLRAFVVVVLGGLGSLAGAVVAGLGLGVVQALSVAYLSAGIADAVLFALLFLALLARPTGLFGQAGAAARVARG